LKALILDALDRETNLEIIPLLASSLEEKRFQNQTLSLRDMDIRPCSSCGRCASKNPGQCTLKDDMEKIYRQWVNSQLVILCTPISFGGYHSRMKMALDRAMPLNTAFFTIRRGELHHENRYHPTPSLMTIGIQKERNSRENEAFHCLTQRNAINMNIDKCTSVVLTLQDTSSEVEERIKRALEEVAGE